MTRLRTATVDDASALAGVHVAAWRVAYRGVMPDDYLDGLDVDERAAFWEQALHRPMRPRAARLVAVDDEDVPVGFLMAGPAERDPDADEGEVYAFNVAPDHWGAGIGTALLTAAQAALRDAGFARAVLWVATANDRARRFYERAGWEADDEVRTQEVFDVEVTEIRYRRDL